MPDPMTKMQELGYEVAVAAKGVDWAAWRVEGFGLSVTLREDDEEAWDGLIASHPERAFQSAAEPDQVEAAMALRAAGFEVLPPTRPDDERVTLVLEHGREPVPFAKLPARAAKLLDR